MRRGAALDLIPALPPGLQVLSLLPQADGALFIAGMAGYESQAGLVATGLLRLKPDASADPAFSLRPDPDGTCSYLGGAE